MDLSGGVHGLTVGGNVAGLTIEGLVCPCNQVSDFPQRCGYHDPQPLGDHGVSATGTAFHLHLGLVEPVPPSLSDEDVDRIARRVVELLKDPA